MFAVWEPILASDRGKPEPMVMGRLSDPRVRQFWDPDHVVARQLAADARDPQPRQSCCVHDGVLWDLLALYPKGVVWTGRAPVAGFFDGPVVKAQPRAEPALLELLQAN